MDPSSTPTISTATAEVVPEGRPNHISVVIADRHPVALEGLDHLLRNAGFNVLAKCTDGDETLRAVRRYRPDVLVLEPQMPRKDGLAVMRDLKRDNAATRVVFLTTKPGEAQLMEAIRLGVRGIVLKEMPAHLLLECVKKVHAGEHWVEKTSVNRLLERLLRREVATRQLALDLTSRELEVVRLVTKGLSNKLIAEQLFITEGTAKMHLHNIYRKLSVRGRMALVLHVQNKGFS